MKLIWAVLLLPSSLWAEGSVLSSKKAPGEFALTADASSSNWSSITGVVMDSDYFGVQVPNHRTEVRSRWTPTNLYLLFICHYERLNLKPEPDRAAETPQLWNWDVAETFLGSDFSNIARYKEFQVSPQGEWIDLDINRTKGERGQGAAWNSGMQVRARVDMTAKVWYGEMMIPFKAIAEGTPAAGRELRAGFFRIAGADPDKKKISWQATGTKTFHVPEKFGILRLVD